MNVQYSIDEKRAREAHAGAVLLPSLILFLVLFFIPTYPDDHCFVVWNRVIK
jgi:hypothetical protein